MLCISKRTRFAVSFSRSFKCHTFTSTRPSITDEREGKVCRMVYLTFWCFVFQNILDLLLFFQLLQVSYIYRHLQIKEKGNMENCLAYGLVLCITKCFRFASFFSMYFKCHTFTSTHNSLTDQREGKCGEWFILRFDALYFNMFSICCFLSLVLQLSYIYLHPP